MEPNPQNQTVRALRSIRRWAPGALIAAVTLAAYANTFSARGFVWDDRPIIFLNPLLRGWSSLPRLLFSGYWESTSGYGASVQEYRPVLMATYFATTRLFGAAPWAFHFGNIAIHVVNGLLLWRLLKRRYGGRIAFWAAVLFAVLPIHSEAVASVTGRSELLASLWLLCAWLEWDGPRPRAPRLYLWFILALLTKEQAVVFPAVLALWDWTFYRRNPWERGVRGAYAGMAVCVMGYLALRWAVLGRPFHGGWDYFEGRPWDVRWLTMARFACAHYLAPMLTGLGLRFDYSRPLIPDWGPRNLAAWACAAGWTALLVESVRRWLTDARGAAYAVWVLGAFVFFLPASNLIVPLDNIGGERFMYFPSMAACLLLARGFNGRANGGRRGFAAVCLAGLASWYGIRTMLRNRVWLDEAHFDAAALQENPLSVKATAGWGVYLAWQGRIPEAVEWLERAMAMDPRWALPYYDLAKLRFDRGEFSWSEQLFWRAAERDPNDPDTWMFLAILAERRGDSGRAVALYSRALELRPWDPTAHFDMARLLQASGRTSEAAAHWREYLRLDPSSPDAARVRALLESDAKR